MWASVDVAYSFTVHSESGLQEHQITLSSRSFALRNTDHLDLDIPDFSSERGRAHHGNF